jgi:hypothetical protein
MTVAAAGQGNGIRITSYPEKGRSLGTTLTDGVKMAATGALAGLAVAGVVGGVLALKGKMGFQVIRQTSNGGFMTKSFERTWQGVLGKGLGVGAGVGALAGVSGLKLPFQP